METVKTANFQRAKQEIEPYDDLEELRKENIGRRLATVRAQIYKIKPKPKKSNDPRTTALRENYRKNKNAPTIHLVSNSA